jgi:hypothetical protein
MADHYVADSLLQIIIGTALVPILPHPPSLRITTDIR